MKSSKRAVTLLMITCKQMDGVNKNVLLNSKITGLFQFFTVESADEGLHERVVFVLQSRKAGRSP